MSHTVVFKGNGRKAQCEPNPDYPDGIALDICEGLQTSCLVRLPYPAKECGIHMVRCNDCGMSVAITAAGRPDDPISVRIPCQPRWRGKLGPISWHPQSACRRTHLPPAFWGSSCMYALTRRPFQVGRRFQFRGQ